jgi:hypothetical protein
MQYMILIYGEERAWQALSEEARRGVYAAHAAYAGRLAEAGLLRGGSELAPTTSATTLRVRGGKVLQTDGPFAEAREQLGGYYLIEAADLDEALRWARECPGAFEGCVEVRPLLDGPSGA